ncbi:magnesium transporter [Vibrio sp. J502]|uniref:magnesium transporter n=1 Tax=Vibrio sp. J502 TaxID=2978741 RepID=UPI0039656B96
MTVTTTRIAIQRSGNRFFNGIHVGHHHWWHCGGMKGNWMLGGIIFAAMMANLLIAGIAGVTIPNFTEKMKIDPALAGGMALTTRHRCGWAFCLSRLGDHFDVAIF